MKIKYFVFLALFILMNACSNQDNKLIEVLDKNELLLVGMESCKGYAHSYNQTFNFLKERGIVTYYTPNSFDEINKHFPKEMLNKLNVPYFSQMPFDVNTRKANIVTSWNDNSKLVFQVQYSYFANKRYASNFKDYFTLSITQYPENPFENNTTTQKIISNLPQNYQTLELTEGYNMYKRVDPRNWGKMTNFYEFDNAEISLNSTGGVQYFAWYDGLIYRIIYNIKDTKDKDFDHFIREIILGYDKANAI